MWQLENKILHALTIYKANTASEHWEEKKDLFYKLEATLCWRQSYVGSNHTIKWRNKFCLTGSWECRIRIRISPSAWNDKNNANDFAESSNGGMLGSWKSPLQCYYPNPQPGQCLQCLVPLLKMIPPKTTSRFGCRKNTTNFRLWACMKRVVAWLLLVKHRKTLTSRFQWFFTVYTRFTKWKMHLERYSIHQILKDAFGKNILIWTYLTAVIKKCQGEIRTYSLNFLAIIR